MTNEQVFELAEKNGFQDDFGRWNFTNDNLLDFVFMVEETEREACALICDEVANKHHKQHYPDLESVADECSGKIRQRDEK